MPDGCAQLSSNDIHLKKKRKKSKVFIEGQVAQRAGANSGFLSMKRLGVLLLPPGWDANLSQGYPSIFAGTHLYSWVKGSTVRVKCLA